MNFDVEWSEHDLVQITTVEELDAIIDEVKTESVENSLPIVMTVTRSDVVDDSEFPVPYGVCVSIGHPERSYALYIGLPQGGVAVEPDLDPWPKPLLFDFGGEETEYPPTSTRLRSETATRIVREYVATGLRPTGVEWERVP